MLSFDPSCYVLLQAWVYLIVSNIVSCIILTLLLVKYFLQASCFVSIILNKVLDNYRKEDGEVVGISIGALVLSKPARG